MKLEEILEKYKKLNVQLLYEEAKELLSLISDNELLKLFDSNPEIFSRLSSMKEDNMIGFEKEIKDAIKLFSNLLENKGLSKDEYNAMTKDEIADYMNNLLLKENKDIYNIIKLIEDDLRNTASKNNSSESRERIGTAIETDKVLKKVMAESKKRNY